MSVLVAFPGGPWLEALRDRASHPAFADARAALDRRLAAYHRLLPNLPTRQAGYYHDYFCPDHAVQLTFDPDTPHRHACPIDGAIFSGEPFDSAWGWSVNDQLSDAALRAAVRGVLDPSGPDEALARRILVGYAERYRSLPAAPKPYPGSYTGIACFSALDEDVWIIRLAWAAALLGDALPTDEARRVRDGLLEPARDHLARVRYGQIQNVANWDNAALLTLALVLGDERAVSDVLDGRWGVGDELARGVGPDGIWWEVSLSYHYYVLAALAWTIRALRSTGRSFEQEATVREMFRAPLELAFPDGSLPAVNDCWYDIGLLGEVGHGIPGSAGFHELAWGWFGDAAFGQILAANLARGPRATLEALLDGSPDLPPAAERPVERRPSRLLDGSGLGVLRGPGEITAIIRAGGDGDAHGHPDQLALQLYGAGQRISIDPGTPGYGIGLNDTWYRQTAAHSTVLLDAASQPPATGRWLDFGPAVATATVAWPAIDGWEDPVERARRFGWPQEASAAYAGVTMARSVRLEDDGLVDRFDVAAPSERTIDWLLHVRGAFEGATEATSGALAGPCGYDELTDVRRVAVTGGPLRFALAGGRLDLLPVADGEEEWFLASAPGNPAAERHLLLVRRRHTTRTTFEVRIAVRPV